MILISVLVYAIIGAFIVGPNDLHPLYVIFWPVVAISWLYHILKAKPKESIEQWCQRCMYNGIRSPNVCVTCDWIDGKPPTLSNFKMLQMNKRLLDDS